MRSCRTKLAIALLLPITPVVLWFRYAPEHWLLNEGTVAATVDGQPVQAEFYIGNPTHREDEAIALFRVPRAGAYFLSFDDEEYREASEREFLRVPWGVWTYKSMRSARFAAPLPFQGMNELRVVSSSGQIVVVRF